MIPYRIVTPILTVGALAAAPAAADDTKRYTDSTMSYSAYDLDGDEVASFLITVTGVYDYGPFVLSGTYAGQSGTVGDEGFGTFNFTGQLSYDLSPVTAIYLAGGIHNTEIQETYLAEAGVSYGSGPFWVSAFAGDNSSGDVIADDYLGVSGGYDFGQGTEAVLSYYAAGGDEEDIAALNILHQSERLEISADILHSDTATYVFTSAEILVSSRVALLADYDHFDLGGETSEHIAVGGSYDLPGALAAFAKVSRTDRPSGGDVDGLSVGLTYATGDRSLRGQSSVDRVVLPKALSDPLQRF